MTLVVLDAFSYSSSYLFRSASLVHVEVAAAEVVVVVEETSVVELGVDGTSP